MPEPGVDERLAVSRRQLVIGSAYLLSRIDDGIFSHKRDKVNFFEATDSGKIILINTAVWFLRQEECSIFGEEFFGY